MTILNQETIDICKDKVKVSFDAEKIGNEMYDLAKKIGKNYSIKGFRKGKAPPEAVLQVAKKQILEEIKKKLVNEAFEDIIFENKWKPFGSPVVNDVNITTKNFYAEMTVGYLPKFDLKQYKDFDIENPEGLPTIDMIKEKMTEGVCEQLGELKELDEDEFVLLGDLATINYEGTVNGEPFNGGKAENVEILMGRDKTIDGLEDQIIGMSIGEDREINVKFPENFKNEVLSNKDAVFNVKLVSAKRIKPAEYNEGLAKKAGFEKLEGLEDAIIKKANEQLEEIKFKHFRGIIVEKLLENNDIDVPEWMAEDMVKSIIRMNDKKSEDLSEEEKTVIHNDAIRKLKIAFMFDKIKEQEVDVVLSDEEIIQTINANIPRFPENVRNMLMKGTNPKLANQIANEIQDEHLVRWIINNSNVINKQEEVS